MNKSIWKFSDEAYKNFQKLDKFTKKILIKWIDTHIVEFGDIKWGKTLNAVYIKYNVGRHRILFKVNSKEFIVLAIKENNPKK